VPLQASSPRRAVAVVHAPAETLGRFLRHGKLVPNDRLVDQIEPHPSDGEVEDVLQADVIASGLLDGEQVHLVVGVSWPSDVDDLVRAGERAKLRQVRIWLDGSLIEASAN